MHGEISIQVAVIVLRAFDVINQIVGERLQLSVWMGSQTIADRLQPLARIPSPKTLETPILSYRGGFTAGPLHRPRIDSPGFLSASDKSPGSSLRD